MSSPASSPSDARIRYSARRVSTRLDELGRLIHAALTSTVTMASVAFLAKAKVSRGWLILCFPAVVVTCCIEREGVRTIFNKLRRAGRSLRPVVLVGANAEAESVAAERDILQNQLEAAQHNLSLLTERLQEPRRPQGGRAAERLGPDEQTLLNQLRHRRPARATSSERAI